MTEREMLTWLAYGSVEPDDLVRREDEEEWFATKLFPEFASVCAPEAETKRTWWAGPSPAEKLLRRQVARRRELSHVAEEQRASVVIWRLLTGFIYRPLTFWKTAGTVFTSVIYRGALDKAGYLRVWPRWMEVPVTVLVILHAIVWTGAVFWAVPRAKAITAMVVETAQDAWHEATLDIPSAAK